jgi:pimeloyl-ACP methyl ester carboxylesterase
MIASKSFLPVYMRAVLLICTVLGISFSALGAGPKGTVSKFTVPKQGSMIADGTYYCWLPESVATMRCIIVHQHGCGHEGDAVMMMSDVQWATLAKKWHAVLIAPSFASGSNCGNWCDMNNGSGSTFLSALDTLARRSGHPEIKTIPWALWGHSGGAMWITAMTGKYPERVAAGVAQSCGTDVANVPAALKVPVLHHNGIGDACHNGPYFINGRVKGALWAFAVNAGSAGHGTGNMRTIAIPWFDFVLAARLPDSSGAPASMMKPMDTTNAYLGDTTTHVIAPAAAYTGNKQIAAWFPNRAMAILWRDYCTTPRSLQGIVKDSTPPPAPYNLTGTYTNRSIVLKWDADADLETGIKTFIVYRNGTLLKTLTYPTKHYWINATGYQGWCYGDETNPYPAPAMTYTDANLSDTATYTYQVSTVNWYDGIGLKSGNLTLSRGNVTAVSAIASAPVTKSRTPYCCLHMGIAGYERFSDLVDIYDIRGRLLLSVDIRSSGVNNVKRLLGTRAANVLVIRNRAR